MGGLELRRLTRDLWLTPWTCRGYLMGRNEGKRAMTTGLVDVVAARGPDVARVLPPGVSIVFDIGDPEGGVWTLACDPEGRLALSEGDSEVADCRMRCSGEDLRDLLAGRLNGRHGYLDGRLQIEGDVGLVLRLQRVLRHSGSQS